MTFIERARREPQRALRLPEYFQTATFTGIKDRSVSEAVEKYLRNFWQAAEQGIAPVLLGRMGRYKTYGACVIARAVHEQDINVDFFDTPSEVPTLDRGWYDGTAQRRMRQLELAALVIVDDFARLRPTGRDVAIMDEIGQRRYNSGLPTIWTGNVDPAAIGAICGEAFERRLRARSAGYRIEVV